MKNSKVNEICRDIAKESRLARHVVKDIKKQAENYSGEKHEQIKKYCNDVMYGGCSSGIVSSLIYYSDTTAFYKKFKNDINELVSIFVSECGESIDKLFRDFDIDDPLALDTHNQNLLAWFGYEEITRKVLDALLEAE